MCKERDVVDKRYRLSIIVQTEVTQEDIVQKEKNEGKAEKKTSIFFPNARIKGRNKEDRLEGYSWLCVIFKNLGIDCFSNIFITILNETLIGFFKPGK